MKMNFSLFISLWVIVLGHAQMSDQAIDLASDDIEFNIYQNLELWETGRKDSFSITEILSEYEKGRFEPSDNNKVYRIQKNENVIFHFRLKNISNSKLITYLTVGNSYLHSGRVYLKYADRTVSLDYINYKADFPYKTTYYRHPTWRIDTQKNEEVDVFVEVIDEESRTRLNFKLRGENAFLQYIELDYLSVGIFVSFLIVLLVSLSVFGFLQKEHSIYYYSIYIGFIITEYLASKGIGLQLLWSEMPFIVENARSMSQCLAVMMASAFFVRFYKYDRNTLWVKKTFMGTFILMCVIVLAYISKVWFEKELKHLYIYVWGVLHWIVILFMILHFLLVYKKRLPFYLGLAFSFPIVGMLIQKEINPSVQLSDFVIWMISNGFYIGITIEILFVSYFILTTVIRSRIQYDQLKQETDSLKLDFQDKIIDTQIQTRNAVVNKVHDSFGSKLALLKLSIIKIRQKDGNFDDTEILKIEDIFDNFNKEYKYLLTSSFFPNVNSKNLILNIESLVNKFDELSEPRVNSMIDLDGKQLNKQSCITIYTISCELLTNAIKHAEAENIDLSIHQNADKVLLVIQDDGIGFNSATKGKNGFGLKNIHDIITKLNGELRISSKRNKGTKINLELPYEV